MHRGVHDSLVDRRWRRLGLTFAVIIAVALGHRGEALGAPPVLPGPPRDGADGGEVDGEGDEGDEAGDELPGVSSGELTPEEVLALELEAQREAEFQDHLVRAKRAAREQRWQEAEREYEAALRIKDNDAEVLQGLGHARRRNTPAGRCPRRAIENLLLLEVYDPKNLWLTERGNAVIWMGVGDCADAYADERLTLSLELAALPPGTAGRPDDIRVIAATELWRRAARSEETKGGSLEEDAAKQLEAYFEEARAADVSPSADALFLRATMRRVAGRLGGAIDDYGRFVDNYPEDKRRKQAEVWMEDLDIQQTVQRLEEAQGGRPTETAEAAYRQGIGALSRGDLTEAQSKFELAVADSPWFPQAYLKLGDLHARRGKFPEAIQALQKAAAMEPLGYEAHMILGILYFREYRGAEDERARTHLNLALRLRPDLYQLHYYLGDLAAREGRENREEAREHFERFLEKCPREDPLYQQAREALQNLEREAVDPERIIVNAPPSTELRRLPAELQRLINQAYVVGAEHGDWEKAETALMSAQTKYPDEPALYNELAKVAAAQGKEGDARVHWTRSLELDPEQLEVNERLGLMLAGEEGMEYLRRAAELGSNTARYELARRLWDGYKLWAASEQLDLYLMAAGPYEVSWPHALALRERIDWLFLRIYVAAGVFGLLVISIPAWRIYRRLRGSSLAQLLDRAPKSFPEVARILSLIRHEILKHNTAFLSDVGHALEMDAPDADARATLLARRLFGTNDPTLDGGRLGQFERRGIYGRFLGYCEELEAVARSHGVTLNLARKDPTFSAMLRAFEDVARRAEWLWHPGKLRGSRRLELARILGHSGDVLGRKAFERLSGIIHELCIVEVTEPLLRAVFQRVCQEDQFRGLDIAPLAFEGAGARIRIFQTDLEDILVNVFRNSLHSAALYAPSPLELGVELELEVDEITGLETLAIRVTDRSPERLTNEMLRGRYVERGMGITADLLSRYDGSIAVEPQTDWEKAVVLRFFAVEEQPGD